MLYPQNDERIVAIDFVTSLYRMYSTDVLRSLLLLYKLLFVNRDALVPLFCSQVIAFVGAAGRAHLQNGGKDVTSEALLAV